MASSGFLTRFRIFNYKSIAYCDVRLGKLSFLVGPNGAGKSNFLDALRFLAEGLNTSLEHAVHERGGLREVCHHSREPTTRFGLALDVTLSDGSQGFYGLLIGPGGGNGFGVLREDCRIRPAGAREAAHFRVEDGRLIRSSAEVAPAASADRLYLVHASGLPEFRPIYDALSHMGIYSFDPSAMRELQPFNGMAQLISDGHNLVGVWHRIATEAPDVKRRIEEYLSKVVPETLGVETRDLGPKATVEFLQLSPHSKEPRRFLAAHMSDGTLRVLAILVALHQSTDGCIPLIGIEEPEIALHPAAAGVLLDSLVEASHRTQLILTSHSPDLLDDDQIGPDEVIPVVLRDGATRMGPLDEFGRSALHDRVATAGELLRLNQVASVEGEEAAQVPDGNWLFTSEART